MAGSYAAIYKILFQNSIFVLILDIYTPQAEYNEAFIDIFTSARLGTNKKGQYNLGHKLYTFFNFSGISYHKQN